MHAVAPGLGERIVDTGKWEEGFAVKRDVGVLLFFFLHALKGTNERGQGHNIIPFVRIKQWIPKGPSTTFENKPETSTHPRKEQGQSPETKKFDKNTRREEKATQD